MMHLLLVNPNTDAAATERFVRLAQAAAGPGMRVSGTTGRFGLALMRRPADLAIGVHAMLDAVAAQSDDWDALLIAAFGDYGAEPAAELFGRPALTLADAAFGALRIARQRYAILVPAPGFESVIGRLPALYGAEGLCTGLAAVSVPPQDPHYAEAAEKALINLVRSASPEAVLAVGPPLTPHLDRLASVCPVPLIEGVACAVEMLRATVNLRLGSRRSTEAVAALAPASIGLSAELASRLKG